MAAIPTNLVNLENVSKSFGTTVVLDGVSLGIAEGERIGVVGRNGGGKSTLLRLLIGSLEPDSGRVTHNRTTRISTVNQSGALPAGATVRAVVLGDVAEYEWARDSGIRAILDGLGLSELGLDTPVAQLSGGEQRRVGLAAALVADTDLLVLDEPTNHLDVEAIDWLAAHLVTMKGSLLVVTHDRWFLDAVCGRMWEVGDGQVRAFEGGYAAYILARAERDRQAGAIESRRQNLLRKELAWLRRGAPARTSKPKFRIDAAEALIGDVPPPRQTTELRSLATRRLGRSVFELDEVSLSVGTEDGPGGRKVLLDKQNWHVGPGDRIGVIGVNGSGKTHLLRLLTGEIEPDTGRVRIGQTVHVGYLSQRVDELPEQLRVIEAVTEAGATGTIDGTELTATQLAERFGFANERQWTPVSDLSGGERRRLQLLRLLLGQPNVLVLDEPTNDLDTDTLAALEDLLDSWAGSVVIVSHDRYLIERVCDSTVALLGDATLAALPGGVDQYLQLRRNRAASGTSSGASARAGRAGRDSRADRETGASAAGPALSAGEERAMRKELQRLEREVSTLTTREAKLHDLLAENATNYERVVELNEQLRTVITERDVAETRWLELAERQ